MNKCYKNPYLLKVIARIDFTSEILLINKGINKETSDKLLSQFPIPETRQTIINEVKINKGKPQETIPKIQNLYFYHGLNRDKLVCISSQFMYLEVATYSTYDSFKEDLFLLMDAMSMYTKFSINRFGLRYINQLNLQGSDVFDWETFLNKNLLSSFDIVEEKSRIARAFSNFALQYDDGMILNFQYGMHNPDFPSRIKKKVFILDYDAYIQGKFESEEIKNSIDTFHNRIEELFESNITQELRLKMGEVNE